MDTINLSESDIMHQTRWPTIMVPRKSVLPDCKVDGKRFLMASDGLYLETRREWGGLVKRLWQLPKRFATLPYGEVQEKDDFRTVLYENVIPIISEVMVPKAAEYAEQNKEWAGFVVWDGAEFLPWDEEFKATGGSAKFVTHGAWNLPEGLTLVADVHTHGRGTPFFSSLDNDSDRGKTKISVVLGNYKVKGDEPAFDWKARYCVEGFFFNGDTRSSVFDDACLQEYLDEEEKLALIEEEDIEDYESSKQYIDLREI